MAPAIDRDFALITIEPHHNGYGVFLGEVLVSAHTTLERARFGAFLEAHRINPAVHRLDLEPDENGNLVALVERARIA